MQIRLNESATIGKTDYEILCDLCDVSEVFSVVREYQIPFMLSDSGWVTRDIAADWRVHLCRNHRHLEDTVPRKAVGRRAKKGKDLIAELAKYIEARNEDDDDDETFEEE